MLKKIVTAVLDIDGVLNSYPDCWVEYINRELGTVFNDLNEAKMTLTYAVYKALKHKYRLSAFKASLPPKDGAKLLTDSLKDKGYNTVLITARPFNMYPKLRDTTTRWLTANMLSFDSIVSSRHKHVTILSSYPEAEFVVEDNRRIANLIAKHGYSVFLLNNVYNRGEVHYRVTRVYSLQEIVERMNAKWF